MPYFYNNDVNILFLHIPKTGGTSLENYFEKKFEIKLNKDSLFTIYPKDFFKGYSFQHQSYKTIRMNKPVFRIDYDNLTVISIVRNPYNRIVSDLFFRNLIKESSNPNDVYNVIKKYLEEANDPKHDNHRIPQYLFLLDENDEIIKNIKLLRTESLNQDIKALGYNDFNQHDQVSSVKNKNYYSYLNIDSINLINEFYEKDFEYFGYKKISTENSVDFCQTLVNEEIIQSKKTIDKYLNKYFESIRGYVSSSQTIDKIELNKILLPINREITDNYSSCCNKFVEELSINYKDIIEI